MEVKSINEFNDIINSDKITVVDFFATWCGPCKMLAPVFVNVANECREIANFVKIDIDQLNEIASFYDVQSIPTVIFFKNKNEIARHVGFIDSETLTEKIKSLL